MYKIYARLDLRFLPFSLALIVVLRFLSSPTFSAVTHVEIAKTDASFWTADSSSEDIFWYNSLSFYTRNI